MTVKVSTLVEGKGAQVVTARPDATLAEVAAALTEHGIGAVVVCGDDRAVVGVLSERDIVHRLATDGAAALDTSAADAMTTDVVTCGWETTTDELVTAMTERRMRHVPVVEEGRLVAIVSIGDVVKARMDELTDETDQLQAYVSGRY